MIQELFGDNGGALMAAAIGKRITSSVIVEDALLLIFEDGSGFRLYDNGQTCCEERYMYTSDDPVDLVGGRLLNIEIRDAPNIPDEYSEHEVQFLRVTTDKSAITLETHNKHNGYYGGFAPQAEALEKED